MFVMLLIGAVTAKSGKCLSMGWKTTDQILAEAGIFFFATMTMPALGHTEPPLQWVPRGKAA
jgi:hypothetical protein